MTYRVQRALFDGTYSRAAGKIFEGRGGYNRSGFGCFEGKIRHRSHRPELLACVRRLAGTPSYHLGCTVTEPPRSDVPLNILSPIKDTASDTDVRAAATVYSFARRSACRTTPTSCVFGVSY